MSRNPLGDDGSSYGESGDQINQSMNSSEGDYVFQEEKKPLNRSLVALLLMVIIGGGGLYLMYLRGGFQRQIAVDPAADQAKTTIDAFLGSASENREKMRALLDGTQKAVDTVGMLQTPVQVPTDKLKTNPFLSPKKDAVETRTGAVAEDLPTIVKRHAEKLEIKMIARNGATWQCIVNGVFLLIDQKIPVGDYEFTVKAMDAKTVTFSCQGIEVKREIAQSKLDAR